MIPLSVLDLCPIVESGTAADAFRRTIDLAQHAERLGYSRFWLAEHHNMPGIASAATAVLIGQSRFSVISVCSVANFRQVTAARTLKRGSRHSPLSMTSVSRSTASQTSTNRV